MKKLYKYQESFGRMGDLSGVFIADEKEIAAIRDKKINFGEILGKHSDITGTMSSEYLFELSDKKDLIKLFQEHVGTVGINPLSYYEPEDE